MTVSSAVTEENAGQTHRLKATANPGLTGKTMMNPESLLALLASSAIIAATGSIHCVGMCGGISSALTFAVPERQRQGGALWWWQAILGMGRVTTYTLLGLLAGVLGNKLLGWLPGPSMAFGLALSGVLMLLLAMHLSGKGGLLAHLERLGQGLWRTLQPLTRKLMPLDHPLKAWLLGMLWGFLPCGLVYTALALAATSGEAFTGGAVMAVFGAITVIPVATTGVVASQLQAFRGPKARKIAVGLTLVLAVLFLFMAWQMANGEGHAMHQHAAKLEPTLGNDALPQDHSETHHHDH